MADPHADTSDPHADTKVDLESKYAQNFFADDESEYSLQFAAATHIGKVRKLNEDHYAVIRRTRQCEVLLSNLAVDQLELVNGHAYGLLVADGVGGADHGDFASQLVLETTLQAAGLATNWLMKFKDLDAQDVEKRVAAYVGRIRDEFHRQASADPDKKQMGTTLTVAYLLPPHAIIAHIGDSRAYLLRDQVLTQVTRDHTLAQALIDAGSEPDDVKKFGNVLVNSIDPMRDEIKAEVLHLELQNGDRLLLCTDGLSDLVDADSITAILAGQDLQVACDQLVESALEAGGRDNITVIVCDLVAQT